MGIELELLPASVLPLSVCTFQYIGAATAAPEVTSIVTGASRPLNVKLLRIVRWSPTVIVAVHPSPATCWAVPTSGSGVDVPACVGAVTGVDGASVLDTAMVPGGDADVLSVESLLQPANITLTAAHITTPPATPLKVTINLIPSVLEHLRPADIVSERTNGGRVPTAFSANGPSADPSKVVLQHREPPPPTIPGMTQRYRSPGAFQMALNARIKSVATATGAPAAQVRRQFLAQRFLARVFADPTAPWVLTGGTGLLVRLAGARHSEDLDLLHTSGTDTAAALADLRHTINATDDLDPFRFTISDPATLHGLTGGATVRVRARLGTTDAGNFPVDLAVGRSTVGHVDRLAPAPVLALEGLTPAPQIALYPIADQIADKVAATYYRYGPRSSPSTRFHDLVDLLFIVTHCPVPAADTSAALASEFRRREMPAVAAISAPGDRWHDGYRRTARLAGVSDDLDAALTAVGACLNPLLDGTRSTGTWSPDAASWCDG